MKTCVSLARERVSVAIFEWTVDEDDEFWPCPMACGEGTKDEAGGPCLACWDLVE